MIGVTRRLELLQDAFAGEKQAFLVLPSRCLLGCKSFSFRGGNGGGVGLLQFDGLAFPTSRHNKDYIRRGPRLRVGGTGWRRGVTQVCNNAREIDLRCLSPKGVKMFVWERKIALLGR